MQKINSSLYQEKRRGQKKGLQSTNMLNITTAAVDILTRSAFIIYLINLEY